MVTAGALHAGSRVLLPIRRSFSTPWSHVRSHLHSTKPPSAPLPPPPPPPPSSHAASTRFTPAFTPTTRRSGSIGSGVVAWYLGSIEARPLLTKSITAAAIYTVADLTSQVTFSSIALSPNFHFLEETLLVLISVALEFWNGLESRNLIRFSSRGCSYFVCNYGREKSCRCSVRVAETRKINFLEMVLYYHQHKFIRYISV